MRKLISVLLAGVLAVVMFAGCNILQASNGSSSSHDSDVKIEGNGRQVVSDGKFVYYVGDDREQIRRISVDNLSGESELVYEGNVYSLNLSADGRLFFSHADGISWIKFGDKDKTDLIKLDKFVDVVLGGDWIYFYAQPGNEEYSQGIYRADINTSEVEMIVDGNKSLGGTFGYRLAGDFLYYAAYDNQTFGLVKTDVNTGKSLLISKDKEHMHSFFVSRFYVTNEYIFFNTDDDAYVKRMNLDGQNQKDLCVQGGSKAVDILFADADFVYFENHGAERGVYRVKVDGTDYKQLSEGDDGWSPVGFVAGKIFARFYEGKDVVFCVDRDGKNIYKLQ